MDLAAKRQLARDLLIETLLETAPTRLLAGAIRIEGGRLHVAGIDQTYARESIGRVLVLAFGKAALPMCQGWLRATQAWLPATGVVCSPDAPASGALPAGFQLFRGGHPEPNAASLAAATAMLAAAQAAGSDALVVYLVSGGGSALVEKPAPAGLGLEELQATYRALVLGGAPIDEINVIRKHLSAFKGGRLAVAAGGGHQLSLVISDVASTDPGAVSSGPSLPDRSTVDDCYRIAREHEFAFPPRIARLFETRQLEETPKPGDPAFVHTRASVLMNNGGACEILRCKTEAAAVWAVVDHAADEWPYERAADYLLGRLAELQREHADAGLIAGGEVLVKVHGDAGHGGRNQQFALLCAERIAGSQLSVMSAGTDGIDGNTGAAGAIVDGTTAARLRAAGFDIGRHLRAFDAYPPLAAIRDTIEIGATGNNVRDLRLLF